MARAGHIAVLRAAAATHIEVIRNTPLLVQLFIIVAGAA